MKNKTLDKLGKGLGLATALGFCMLIVPDKATAAFSISTDVTNPMTTITTGADTVASNMAPIGIGMFGFGAIATVAKRIIYSA